MALATPVLRDDIFNSEAVRNARAVDDALRELAPVVKLERENITMLARYEHVAEGLKDWQAFSSRSRRQAWSAATCSISTDSDTVRIPAPPPA